MPSPPIVPQTPRVVRIGLCVYTILTVPKGTLGNGEGYALFSPICKCLTSPGSQSGERNLVQAYESHIT